MKILNFFISFMLVIVNILNGWEPPVKIARAENHIYEKAQVVIGSDNKAYIVYRDKNKLTMQSDIYLAVFNGEKVEKVINVSESNYSSYQPDIAINGNKIFVAWVEYDRANRTKQIIRLREFDGEKWSKTETLGNISNIVYDLRLGVDKNENVFVLFMDEELAKTYLICKYEDGIEPLYTISPGTRSKHPDLAVGEKYIHIAWQQKFGAYYRVMYQKKENKYKGKFLPIVQVTFTEGTASHQRPRIALDSEENLHMVYFKKLNVLKKMKYIKNINGKFSEPVDVSKPEELLLYHYPDFDIKNGVYIATMQEGGFDAGNGIFFNIFKNEEWQGYSIVPGTSELHPGHASVSLSSDGEVAAVALISGNYSGVYLVTSKKLEPNEPPVPVMNVPKSVFWGEEAELDGSESYDPDGEIVRYIWEIGENSLIEGEKVTYKFKDDYGDVKVRLTVYDDKEGIAFTENIIKVRAIYTPIDLEVKTVKARLLLINKKVNLLKWRENSKNKENGFEIVKYRIYRKEDENSSNFELIDEVKKFSDNFNYYIDYKIDETKRYMYVVTAVDKDNHESPFDNF